MVTTFIKIPKWKTDFPEFPRFSQNNLSIHNIKREHPLQESTTWAGFAQIFLWLNYSPCSWLLYLIHSSWPNHRCKKSSSKWPDSSCRF